MTHTLPGSPEAIAIEVPEGAYGFNVFDLMKKGQALFFEDRTRVFDVDLPPGQWEIVGLASELVKQPYVFMKPHHFEIENTDGERYWKESRWFGKSDIPYINPFDALKSLFKAANLSPEKEYAILRKTN